MMMPVRCFSCGKVIGSLYEPYIKQVQEGADPREVLDNLGLKRYCCRRVVVAHVSLIDDVAPFSG
jgi:DNA-directed RNA polymerase subunit N